jgi:hypothetical protein
MSLFWELPQAIDISASTTYTLSTIHSYHFFTSDFAAMSCGSVKTIKGRLCSTGGSIV